MTIKDVNLTIMVSDLDRSIAFYQSIGLELKNRWDKHYAQLAIAGLVIGLHPAGNNTLKVGSGNVSIGFFALDFEGAKSGLQKSGIPIKERSEDGGQFIHFNDPDGTALYFIKPKW